MMKVVILKKMNRLDDALEVCDSYIESHNEFMDFDYGDFKVSREFPQSEKIFSLREEILGEMESYSFLPFNYKTNNKMHINPRMMIAYKISSK